MNFNWRDIDWDIPMLGRLLAIAIIVGGIIVAALDASAFNLPRSAGAYSHFRLRYFAGGCIPFLWKSGLVFAAAEVADRFGWGGRRVIDWRAPEVLRLLGAIVIVAGITLTVWNWLDINFDDHAQRTRLVIRSVISIVWQGGVLFLAAELVDRMGWRKEEPPETTAEAAA